MSSKLCIGLRSGCFLKAWNKNIGDGAGDGLLAPGASGKNGVADAVVWEQDDVGGVDTESATLGVDVCDSVAVDGSAVDLPGETDGGLQGGGEGVGFEPGAGGVGG